MSIRLVLADDHAQFRTFLADSLARQPGIEVVAQAEDGEAAVRAVQALPAPRAPHVVVMDVEMRGGGGIEATRRLRSLFPDLPVLALSMHDEPAFVAAMFAAGAQGYVLKGESMDELLKAIRTVAAGRHYAGPDKT